MEIWLIRLSTINLYSAEMLTAAVYLNLIRVTILRPDLRYPWALVQKFLAVGFR
jgi:hypothetical protein